MTTQEQSQYSLPSGQLFEDNYEIVREIGRGGFGVIYLAHQVSMDRRVALKILKPDVGRHDPSARTRFLREVKIISKLRHPNTITIHDYGETGDGVIYMVLEYVEGTSLKKVLEHRGARPVMKSLGYARQIARSLDEAHRHDVIHRDLKPGNIMLTDLEGEADFVKVLDFGVARLRGSQDVDLTQAAVDDGERALIGTPRYMSPEQVRGDELTGASDLYSLGLLLYEMLVGEPAVQGDTSMALISQQISPEPLKLTDLESLHPRVQDLLRRATDKDIDQRFQTGDAFADAVDETVRRIEAEQTGGPSREDDFFATGPMSAVSSSSGSPPDRRSQTSASSAESDEILSSVDTDAARQSGRQQQSERQQQQESWEGPDFSASDFDYDPEEADETELYTPELDDPHAKRRTGDNHSTGPTGDDDTAAVYVDEPPPDDESRLLGIPSGELPDAPADAEPAFTDEASDQTSAVRTGDGDKKPRPPITAFDIVKTCLLGLLAAFFVYAAFVVVGAMTAFVTGGLLQTVAAIATGIGIPLFSALGENSQKERFEAVQRVTDRISRVFIGSAIFAAGVVVIISFAMPGPVTDKLHSEPNWMFDAPSQPDDWSAAGINTRLSAGLATTIEMVTLDIGWTGVIGDDPRTDRDTDDTDESAEPDGFDAPEPTRPGTRDDEDEQHDEQHDPRRPDDEQPTPAPRGGPAADPDEPADTDRAGDDEPATDDEDRDDDYVTW